MSDKFQRYVWVNSERKRVANREKTAMRKSVFDAKNETQSIPEDPPKLPNVKWPGQLQEQLAKVKKRSGPHKRLSEDSLYIRTPDTIYSDEEENRSEIVDEVILSPEPDFEDGEINEEPTKTRKMSDTPIPDYSRYNDYYLQPPIPLNHTDSSPFFLVTTNVKKV